MNYEKLLSRGRFGRYKRAAHGNETTAFEIYKLNLEMQKEVYEVIAYFEIILRNAIDSYFCRNFRTNWLFDFKRNVSFFSTMKIKPTKTNSNPINETDNLIVKAVGSLTKNKNKNNSAYTPSNNEILTELTLGFWQYLFDRAQFAHSKKQKPNSRNHYTLLSIGNTKPLTSSDLSYLNSISSHRTPIQTLNNMDIFHLIKQIAHIRNRVAHHEPICFDNRVLDCCDSLELLLKWLGVDLVQLIGKDLIAEIKRIHSSIQNRLNNPNPPITTT